MSVNLTQGESDALFQIKKYQADDKAYNYLAQGGRHAEPLLFIDGKEKFIFDIYRWNMRTTNRQKLSRTILVNFGIQINRNALVIQISSEIFLLRKHNLVQAINVRGDIVA